MIYYFFERNYSVHLRNSQLEYIRINKKRKPTKRTANYYSGFYVTLNNGKGKIFYPSPLFCCSKYIDLKSIKKYIMLKFKQFLQKKSIISRLRNSIRFCYENKQRNLSLLTNNQKIKSVISDNEFYVYSLENYIKYLIKQGEKFLTADQIFSILSAKKNDIKFTAKEVDLALRELEKCRKIYLYKLPILDIELWGTANLLDRNLIPVENCITDENCRARVHSYKIQNHL